MAAAASVALRCGAASLAGAFAQYSALCDYRQRRPLQHRVTPLGSFTMLTETPEQPSTMLFFMGIGGSSVSKTEVASTFGQKVAPAEPRLRSRLVGYEQRRPQAFELQDSFDPAENIDEVESQDVPTDRREMSRLLCGQYLAEMDGSKPLWRMAVANGVQAAQERSEELPNDPMSELRLSGVNTLLTFRCHHVVSDGVSMSFVFLDLFDEAIDMQAFVQSEIDKHVSKSRKKSLLLKVLRTLGMVVAVFVQGILGIAHHLFLSATATRPMSLTRRRFQGFPENRFGFRANCISVSDAKQVAHALSKKATLNDLMLTCLARAIGKVCGDDLQRHRSVNVSMPVHLQGGILLDGQGLGNRIGAHTIRLPIIKEDSDIRTQVSQLDEVSRSCRFVKSTPMAILAAASAYLTATFLPGYALDILQSASAGTLMTVSNVRGPTSAVHLNNRPVSAIVPFVPPPPGVPVGIMVSSYNGMVTLTANVDPEIVPDAQAVVDTMLEEYYALKRAARLVTGNLPGRATPKAAMPLQQ